MTAMPLFPGLLGVLQPKFMKSQCHGIVCPDYCPTLKFDRHPDSAALATPAEFQSDQITVKPHLVASSIFFDCKTFYHLDAHDNCGIMGKYSAMPFYCGQYLPKSSQCTPHTSPFVVSKFYLPSLVVIAAMHHDILGRVTTARKCT